MEDSRNHGEYSASGNDTRHLATVPSLPCQDRPWGRSSASRGLGKHPRRSSWPPPRRAHTGCAWITRSELESGCDLRSAGHGPASKLQGRPGSGCPGFRLRIVGLLRLEIRETQQRHSRGAGQPDKMIQHGRKTLFHFIMKMLDIPFIRFCQRLF